MSFRSSDRVMLFRMFFVAVVLQALWRVLGYGGDTFSKFDYAVFMVCLAVGWLYWSNLPLWVRGALFGVAAQAAGYSLVSDGGGILLVMMGSPIDTVNSYYATMGLILSPFTQFGSGKELSPVFRTLVYYLYPITLGALIAVVVKVFKE